MDEHNKIINEYKESFVLTRKIIVRLISRLEGVVDDKGNISVNSDEWDLMWGSKENVVSVLTKLTTLLVKVVPMEKELLDSDKADKKSSNVGRIINSDDKEIIKRYLRKYNKQ